MKMICAVLWGVMPVAALGQTIRPVQHCNGVVVTPTNFWSADAANARAGLGLGTAATNSAAAFQTASAALTNLANNNAINLTNFPALPITNIAGLSGALDGKLATNGTLAAEQITDFSNAVVAVAPQTTNAGLLTGGTLDDGRLSANVATTLTNARAVAWVANPAATNSAGLPGQVAYASNHLYICVATNTWRRVQLGTW
ncbi:MAG: hypothetical protein FGM15_05390 [Chthoniobacterales bacterium]|nr:hypothetical protein [Chthoniobacterales bacterium]